MSLPQVEIGEPPAASVLDGLEVPEVLVVRVDEECQIVGSLEEPHGDYQIVLEEALRMHDDADELALIDQRFANVPKLAATVAKYYILTGVDFELVP
jgi:hypothetical protein